MVADTAVRPAWGNFSVYILDIIKYFNQLKAPSITVGGNRNIKPRALYYI